MMQYIYYKRFAFRLWHFPYSGSTPIFVILLFPYPCLYCTFLVVVVIVVNVIEYLNCFYILKKVINLSLMQIRLVTFLKVSHII